MKRSKFSLSHYKLLTSDMGQLIPLTWYDVIPGDSVQQSSNLLIRVSPLLAPIMHAVRVRVHHFFTPLSLIWDEFEEFITGGEDGTATPEHPYFSKSAITQGSLHDYLGVPPDAAYSPDIHFSALPMRAYNLIYNEHYRDQDLVTKAVIDLTSGLDTTTFQDGHKCAWEKDYFTTCRPWETKGNAITIPLDGDAPVHGIGHQAQDYPANAVNVYETDGIGTTQYATGRTTYADNKITVEQDPTNAGYPNIRADLSGAAAGMDINDLRLALGLQRYQERSAQYGSRYSEYLRAMGVTPDDGRLGNPEYLGGGKQVLQFSEVLSTDGANTGDMKGHGITGLRTNRFRRFFKEHGIVMTVMSVVPKAIYTSSLHRSFLHDTKEEYFQRELQNIGEQIVTNREIQSNHSAPDDVFGYQARYNEYRQIPSTIAGEFRTTEDHWHYARQFAADVALNQSFTDCTPTKRVNADTNAHCLMIMANHSIQARRLMDPVARNKTF